MKRILWFLPLIVAVVIGGFALWGLVADRDPSGIPSVLIGQPAPVIALDPVPELGTPGLSTADLTAGGQPVLVNFFASWCVPCKAEHAVLTRLTREHGVTLYGVNYKDKAEDARRWLNDLGNPYSRIGWDISGRAGIEWGISGVPETFVIRGDGVVVYRYVGPIVGADAQKKVLSALREAGLEEPAS